MMEASDSTETSTGLNGIASQTTGVFIHRHIPVAKRRTWMGWGGCQLTLLAEFI